MKHETLLKLSPTFTAFTMSCLHQCDIMGQTWSMHYWYSS